MKPRTLAALAVLSLVPAAAAQQPAPGAAPAAPQVFPTEYVLKLTPDQINALYDEVDKSTGSHVDIERMKALIRAQVIAQNEAAKAAQAAPAATPPKP